MACACDWDDYTAWAWWESTQLNDIDHWLVPRWQKWHWSRHQPSALPRPRPFSSLVISFLCFSLHGILVLAQLLLELFLPCVSLLWYVAPGGIYSEFLPSKRFYFISVAEERLCWCLGNCVQVLWYPDAVSPFGLLWRHGQSVSTSIFCFLFRHKFVCSAQRIVFFLLLYP